MEPFADRPDAVLFACTTNALRSPMAEALMKHYLGRTVYVDSVGVRPAAEVDPFAAAAMEEIGLDISRHRPKSFGELEDTSFDLAISLSPEAQHAAVELARHHAIELVYWPTLDPSLESGNREQVLAAYRGVRDGLAERIRSAFLAGAPPNP
ncbi:MAG: low molecular weight phosphatase family protein [Alphaproteobacteria bacterium]